jgi:hypothetical protein
MRNGGKSGASCQTSVAALFCLGTEPPTSTWWMMLETQANSSSPTNTGASSTQSFWCGLPT